MEQDEGRGQQGERSRIADEEPTNLEFTQVAHAFATPG